MSNENNSFGNRKITLSIPFAVFALLLTILGMLVPSVYAYGQLNSRVDSLEDSFGTAGPGYEEDIEKLQDKISIFERHVASSEVILRNMKEDLSEIKADVKEIKRSI